MPDADSLSDKIPRFESSGICIARQRIIRQTCISVNKFNSFLVLNWLKEQNLRWIIMKFALSKRFIEKCHFSKALFELSVISTNIKLSLLVAKCRKYRWLVY
jgi:hypothetical protein